MPVPHQVDHTPGQQDRDLPLTHDMLSFIRFSLGGIDDVDAGAALDGMADVRHRQHIVWGDLFPVTWSHKAQRQNTTIDEILIALFARASVRAKLWAITALTPR